MALKEKDLENLVKHIFEIDNYKSKLGDDEEICVLSFTVFYQDAAADLENFFEMGYEFVLDADTTTGEMDDGNYRVFVEIERNRHLGKQIMELLDGLKRLTGIDTFKFRYYKNFRSQEANEENLDAVIPKDKDSYKIMNTQFQMENFSNFFANSYSDSVNLVDESIVFTKSRSESLKFHIVDSGSKEVVYNNIKGPIMLESRDISEIMFLTKYIGNYNITKIGNTFVFENNGWAVALERK